MKDNEAINRRILISYQLMLDFFGMRLENESTGLISRSKNYASQYRNLCSTYFCPGFAMRPRPLPWMGGRTLDATLRCLETLSYPSVHFVSPGVAGWSTAMMLPLHHYTGRAIGLSAYHPLTGSPHNNLRISRILKFLSELGYEYLNYGFLLHVLNEQSEHGQLSTSLIRSSMDCWWANCLRGGRERDWINQKIASVRRGGVDEPSVFTREMYEEALGNGTNEGRF